MRWQFVIVMLGFFSLLGFITWLIFQNIAMKREINHNREFMRIMNAKGSDQ